VRRRIDRILGRKRGGVAEDPGDFAFQQAQDIMTTYYGHMWIGMNIPAAIFKAECLKLMDDVARTGQSVVITKHGKPVAQLVPLPAQSQSFFGYMKHTFKIQGEVVAPIEETWSAKSGDEDHLYTNPRKMRRKSSASIAQ
jgi:prevent-host-death family protein